MRFFGILIILVCFNSCQYFDKEKLNTDDIVNEELKAINWNEVDEYPTFENCASSTDQNQRKLCFERSLTDHISTQILESNIIVSNPVNDTIMLSFQISEKGHLSILKISNSEAVKQQIPEIDSLLINSLSNMPQIFPAIKRGQHVSTAFTLPVVINSN